MFWCDEIGSNIDDKILALTSDRVMPINFIIYTETFLNCVKTVDLGRGSTTLPSCWKFK